MADFFHSNSGSKLLGKALILSSLYRKEIWILLYIFFAVLNFSFSSVMHSFFALFLAGSISILLVVESSKTQRLSLTLSILTLYTIGDSLMLFLDIPEFFNFGMFIILLAEFMLVKYFFPLSKRIDFGSFTGLSGLIITFATSFYFTYFYVLELLPDNLLLMLFIKSLVITTLLSAIINIRNDLPFAVMALSVISVVLIMLSYIALAHYFSDKSVNSFKTVYQILHYSSKLLLALLFLRNVGLEVPKSRKVKFLS